MIRCSADHGVMSARARPALSMSAWVARFDEAGLCVDTETGGHHTLARSSSGGLRAEPWHRLTLVLRGEGVCIFRTERETLPAGAAVWIQPGVAHDWQGTEGTDVLQLGFTFAGSAPTPRLEPAWLYSPEAWSLRDRMELVLEEQALPMPQSARRIKWSLALAVTDMMRQSSHYRQMHGLTANQRGRLMRFVSGRELERITVGELAEAIGLSEDYFGRRFRRTFGQSPQAWLMRRRMLAAGRHLRDSEMTIAQCAALADYTDVSQFTRQFRRTLGVPPSRYRRA